LPVWIYYTRWQPAYLRQETATLPADRWQGKSFAQKIFQASGYSTFAQGKGFFDIGGLPFDVLTEKIVRQAGGAWLSDIDCDTTNTAFFTSAATQQQLGLVYVLQTPYGELRDSTIGLDGLPIVFSWPVLTNTIDLTDFQFTLNTGEFMRPLAASSQPNWENNERNCVVVWNDWGNRLPSSDPNTRFPVKLEIVADDTPLTLVAVAVRSQKVFRI